MDYEYYQSRVRPVRKPKEPGKYQRIIYQPGKVTRIIINRPKYLNAISHPTYGEIEDAFDDAAANPECRVIVVSGNGPCFAAGHDAIGLTPESAPMLRDGMPPEELMKKYGSEREVWRQYNQEHHYFLNEMHVKKMHHIPVPTIAMVHGYAIWGGFFLAGAMDIIFASEDALFLAENGQSDPGTWDWGPRKMLEVMFEHRFLTARECHEYHMVNRVFPNRDILEKETMAYAERVADNNEVTHIRAIKEAVYHTRDIQGFTIACEDTWNIHSRSRQNTPEVERHAERYEGRGMARTPRALSNLKAKLESEGKEVPKLVQDALARAQARDDRGIWEKALHQPWRDKKRVDAAEKEAKLHTEDKV